MLETANLKCVFIFLLFKNGSNKQHTNEFFSASSSPQQLIVSFRLAINADIIFAGAQPYASEIFVRYPLCNLTWVKI